MIGAVISPRVTFLRPNIGTGTWEENGLITKRIERRRKSSVNISILDMGDLEEYNEGKSNQWSVGQVSGLLYSLGRAVFLLYSVDPALSLA